MLSETRGEVLDRQHLINVVNPAWDMGRRFARHHTEGAQRAAPRAR